MVFRRPLVLISGQIQQLPANDSLDAYTRESGMLILANKHTLSLPIGTPVFLSGANECQPARANSSEASQVIGLLRDLTVAVNGTGTIQTDSVLVATTAQWDVVTGQTGGLTPRSNYFLSTVAGKLTATVPSSNGEYVIRIGRAINSTTLEISIQPSILL